MQIEFSRLVQAVADGEGGEVAASQIWDLFRAAYLERHRPFELVSYAVDSGDVDRIRAVVGIEGLEHEITGEGNGPIAALVHALAAIGVTAQVLDYHEHATSSGEEAQAAAYLEVAVGDTVRWGCGISPSITTASLEALISAVNRV